MTVLLISLELQISLHHLFLLLLLSEPLIHIARSLTCIIGKIPISASPAHFFVVFNWKLIPLILPSAIRLGWPSPDGVVPSGRALKKHKTSLTRKKRRKKNLRNAKLTLELINGLLLVFPVTVACSTVTVTKCQAALRTLQAFPFFRPTCLCKEPGIDPDCNYFRDFLFDHPCGFVSKKGEYL